MAKGQQRKGPAKRKLRPQITVAGADLAKRPIPNRLWFTERIRQVGLTQRTFAKRIPLDPSSLIRSLKGLRRVQLDEVVRMTELLRTPRNEIIAHLGFPDRDFVVIVGEILLDGEVRLSVPNAEPVKLPPDTPAGVKALVCHAPSGPLAMFDECVFYYDSGVAAVLADNVGRLAIVETTDGRVLGMVSRGTARGRYKVTTFGSGLVVQPKAVKSASPVLWIFLP